MWYENEDDINRLANEAIIQFLPNINTTTNVINYIKTAGSVNNIIRYVEINNDRKYVLRIYNNGSDIAKVEYEHVILQNLKQFNFSFQIPEAINVIDSIDKRIILLSNGCYASLFKLIHGVLPHLKFVKQIGKASGELSYAFEILTKNTLSSNYCNNNIISMSCTPAVYNLYEVHKDITKDIYFNEILKKEYDCCRKEMDYLSSQILNIESLLQPFINNDTIRKQLIHGDLHYDNVLCDELNGEVTAVLDFEFIGFDFKIMELAICLSKYASEPDPLCFFEEFISGFHITTNILPIEAKILPLLIKLRILSNVIFFVARAMVGEDSYTTLTSGRALTYCNRLKWLDDNSSGIIEMTLKYCS